MTARTGTLIQCIQRIARGCFGSRRYMTCSPTRSRSPLGDAGQSGIETGPRRVNHYLSILSFILSSILPPFILSSPILSSILPPFILPSSILPPSILPSILPPILSLGGVVEVL